MVERWVNDQGVDWLRTNEIADNLDDYAPPQRIFGNPGKAGVSRELDHAYKLEPRGGGDPIYLVIEAKAAANELLLALDELDTLQYLQVPTAIRSAKGSPTVKDVVVDRLDISQQ